jgi:hypothetical protein
VKGRSKNDYPLARANAVPTFSPTNMHFQFRRAGITHAFPDVRTEVRHPISFILWVRTFVLARIKGSGKGFQCGARNTTWS